MLQDFCCVEFRNGFFHLASPIREAIRRDVRFSHEDTWHEAIAQAICDTAAEYKEDDDVPVSIIEAATFAQARGATAPAYLKNLVLPSHLLMIARELYDKHLRPQCIEFCKRAYEMKGRMTRDAQVETLRLWGLSAARGNETDEFDFVISELRQFSYPTASRIRLFLEGFYSILTGRLDIAERRFVEAWGLAPRNAHINRELASLYCRQKRYNEAEQYARSSYGIQKTNPYIIDILLETLIGKKSAGQTVDDQEISRLRQELQDQSIESDTIFYDMREAQTKLSVRDYNGAASEVEAALIRNSDIPAVYFLGIDAELGRSNIRGADGYLEKVRILLNQQGQSEGDECKLIEAEANILTEKRQYISARRVIENSHGLPPPFLERLKNNLARTLMFDSVNANAELIAWSNKQLKS